MKYAETPHSLNGNVPNDIDERKLC